MNRRRLARFAEERAPGAVETQAVSSFLRGLTAGALIGAAIAGSALLQRRRASKSHEDRGGGRSSQVTAADGDPTEP
jgi:hypothetical protein